jgi:hypothetical protein
MGEPISLRSLLDATPVTDQARRITRILRGNLRRQRAVRITEADTTLIVVVRFEDKLR